MVSDSPTVIAVPGGHVADVITHLEMLERPQIKIPWSPLSIVKWTKPDPKNYIDLFRSVGEPWLWLSRLVLKEQELTDILHDNENEVFQIKDGDQPVGFIELDFRRSEECEIGFFGLIPAYNGKGLGKWLMAVTFERSWRPGIKRVWLHTCTLDSPFALGFYLNSGFRAFKREISMNPDPRLWDLLPETAGPHIPIIR